jgi:ubiquinone/menaquinone biosynthesis C-methylase UbiE
MDKVWTGERLETFVQNDTTVEHLHRYSIAIQLVKDKIVLDIACGEGYGANILSQNASFVYGVDIDSLTIANAREKYRSDKINFIEGAADNIPLKDKSVDVVVSFETIEHHDKHDEMLQEIKRVLKDDGMLIMSSPEGSGTSFNPYHIKELSNSEFHELINKYFRNVKYYYQKIVFGSLIIPQTSESASFSSHYGDYNKLNSINGLKDFIFNLCIATDESVSDIGSSFFDGQQVLTENIVKPYKNSKIYRFAKFIRKVLWLR